MRPKSVYRLYRGASALLRTLPGPVARGLAGATGALVAQVSPERRAVVAANLRRVVGDGPSEAELDRLVRRAFAAYGRYWSDATRLDPAEEHLLERRWSIDGAAGYLEAIGRGHGVVLALPHLGSWEIGGIWSASLGHPLTTVAEPAEPRELFDWFVAEREALGLRVLPLGGTTATALLQTLRSGGVVALIADRDIVGDGVEVEFFGARTKLPGGPAVLALRSGAPLMACAVYHGAGDRHHAVIRPPLDTTRRGHLRDDVVRVTQALAHELEHLIATAPEQWHVFQPNWPAAAARGDEPCASR